MIRTCFPIALSLALVPVALSAQSAAPQARPVASAEAPNRAFDKAEAAKVIGELATRIEEEFVFPDVAKAYAARLRSQLAAGAYDHFADGRTFAEKVTADLRAVHEDRHLRLHVDAPEDAQRVRQGPRGQAPAGNAISRSGWLAPGVAYIRFESFPGSDETLDALKAFLVSHASAQTLVIDVRSHRGGGMSEMDVMFPLLFDAPKTLVAMDTRVAVEQRNGGPLEGQWSLRRVAGPEGVVRREHFVVPAAGSSLARAKIFVLTSARTASAAEHLSLSLKRTGRATLVGETTRGAGHYGGMVPVGDGYAAFIPVGRTFDPDTGQGWETVGVKPDVEVPADKALDEALRLAGVAVGGEAALAALK